jgi:hypothetical protein
MVYSSIIRIRQIFFCPNLSVSPCHPWHGDSVVLSCGYIKGVNIMRNWKHCALIGMVAVIVLVFGIVACDTETKCTCPVGTTHEPNEKCCNGTDCKCAIAEPSVREFNDIKLFDNGGLYYFADFIDARTACGSRTLDELDVIKQISDAILEAYNSGINPIKARFRNIFGTEGGRTTITVDNPATYYEGAKILNKYAMSFHISYLNSVPDADLQTNITTAVTTMDDMPMPTD